MGDDLHRFMIGLPSALRGLDPQPTYLCQVYTILVVFVNTY